MRSKGRLPPASALARGRCRSARHVRLPLRLARCDAATEADRPSPECAAWPHWPTHGVAGSVVQPAVRAWACFPRAAAVQRRFERNCRWIPSIGPPGPSAACVSASVLMSKRVPERWSSCADPHCVASTSCAGQAAHAAPARAALDREAGAEGSRPFQGLTRQVARWRRSLICLSAPRAFQPATLPPCHACVPESI